MSTATLDKTDLTSAAATVKPTSPAKTSIPARSAGRLRSLLVPSKEGVARNVKTVFFRGIVLLADYVLAIVTAMVFIPLMGAWLHQQAGLTETSLVGAAGIAMWLVPFLFLVVLLVAGELAIMRSMWRWSTVRLSALSETSTADGRGTAGGSTPRAGTNRSSKKNSKRSK
jgi:hypothetical protein